MVAGPVFVRRRTVRSSKRKFDWRFSLGPRGSEKVVELYISVVSGKRLLMYDGAEILNITSSKDKLHHDCDVRLIAAAEDPAD